MRSFIIFSEVIWLFVIRLHLRHCCRYNLPSETFGHQNADVEKDPNLSLQQFLVSFFSLKANK